jgi:hypothetical protein
MSPRNIKPETRSTGHGTASHREGCLDDPAVEEVMV